MVSPGHVKVIETFYHDLKSSQHWGDVIAIQTVMKPAAAFEDRLDEQRASKTKGKEFLF